MTWKNGTVLLLVLVWSTVFSGCQKTYYAVWEQLGKEKRHLLKDQIEQAREDQQEGTEEFKDALTRLKELYGFQGGDLEAYYDRLKSDFGRSEERAALIDERIARMDQTANDLFEEWEAEIKQITNASFKSKSRQSLADTRLRYARLNKAMVRARARMTPVLQQLQNYVLYLKHNLNAQALGAIQKEARGIEADINALIRDMNSAIQEADQFLQALEQA